jgi:hypothetical protein
MEGVRKYRGVVFINGVKLLAQGLWGKVRDGKSFRRAERGDEGGREGCRM